MVRENTYRPMEEKSARDDDGRKKKPKCNGKKKPAALLLLLFESDGMFVFLKIFLLHPSTSWCVLVWLCDTTHERTMLRASSTLSAGQTCCIPLRTLALRERKGGKRRAEWACEGRISEWLSHKNKIKKGDERARKREKVFFRLFGFRICVCVCVCVCVPPPTSSQRRWPSTWAFYPRATSYRAWFWECSS